MPCHSRKAAWYWWTEQVTQKYVIHQIIQYTEIYQREGAGIVLPGELQGI